MRRMQEQLVLVEKLEALRVLVGGMAHELNNALAVAVASTQQAHKNAENPDAARAALKRAEGGLGRIRSTAVVRNASPEGYGVEFVHMDQDDHDKLRRRLVKLLQ